jgi:hypothetical protein
MALRPKERTSWSEAGAVALVLLATVAVHGHGVARPFFADDYLFLEQVRGRPLLAALTSPDPLGNFLRPVSRAAWFWLLGRAGGESPVLFHLANLALFLGAGALLHGLVRRLLGAAAALFALAFLALHYAADVPLRWAAGAQDLLAFFFGLLAVRLHAGERRAWAAASLLIALLSKETAAGTCLVALLFDRASGRPWRDVLRRGAGLVAVTLGWAAWWLVTLRGRPGAGETLSLAPGNAAAALAHFAQVALGLEGRQGGNPLGHWGLPPLLPALVAAAALAWLVRAPARETAPGEGTARPTLWLGAAWTLTGIVPVILVAPIWSAYFYLWALAGCALLAAAVTDRWSLPLRAGALATLVLLSGQARGLDEFSADGGAWSWTSHVNRHYVDRSLRFLERSLAQLRAARPALTPRTTVFFVNVPNSMGWQAADGPLLRWAYRDSTLRSYYMTQFTKERAARGPVLYFAFEGDSLVDRSADASLLFSFAFEMVMAERPQSAVEALDWAERDAPGLRWAAYLRALARWGAGDTLAARGDFARAGLQPARSLPGRPDDLLRAAGGDTGARIALLRRLGTQAVLSPWVHAQLAALLLSVGDEDGVVEAYAYRVLAPEEPDAWRCWASAQLSQQKYDAALASLERYLALARAAGQGNDAQAEQVAERLRSMVRGGIAREALRLNTRD